MFYTHSDDASRVWLNPDPVTGLDPAGKVMIVEETGCCNSYSAKVSMGGKTYPMTGTFDSGSGRGLNFLFLTRPLVEESLGLVGAEAAGGLLDAAADRLGLALEPGHARHAVRMENALRDLVGNGAAKEAAILSTCNRTEIYTVVLETARGVEETCHFLGESVP